MAEWECVKSVDLCSPCATMSKVAFVRSGSAAMQHRQDVTWSTPGAEETTYILHATMDQRPWSGHEGMLRGD